MAMYDIFISHAWSYSDRYMGVVRLLDSAKGSLPWFDYRNYSVPKHDPLIDPTTPVGARKLRLLLKEQIRNSSCVIVPAGMYVNNRYWIQEEINIAREFSSPKPIIAILRRGQQRTPQDLIELANRVVKWTSDSLAYAIRDVC